MDRKASSPGAIVVIVVESPAPRDPVGTALRTLGSFELGAGGRIETDGSRYGLVANAPWEMGKSIDIRHPNLPNLQTRRRHQVSYVDTKKGFAIYRVNLRFVGDKRRVPTEVTDVAMEIARKWIEARSPSAIYITGRRGSPTESAMASPKSLRDLTWWNWIAELPPSESEDGAVTAHAGGVIIKLSEEFHVKLGLPLSVMPTLGLREAPFIRVGL